MPCSTPPASPLPMIWTLDSPRSSHADRTRRSTGDRIRAVAVAAVSSFAAVVAATSVGVVPSPIASAATGGVIHVAIGGNDAASGASRDPVRSIGRAVRLAGPGDSIEIGAGSYHESVQVYGKELHLRSAPGAHVVLDGASPITGWSAVGGRWWAPWTTDFERSGVPFTTPSRPVAGWPEQFFVDDRNLVEVANVEAVGPGTFFHDRGADRVWIGDDPVGRHVAGSDLDWGLYLNLADGSSVSGITVMRFATTARNMAAVRVHGSDLRLDDVTVVDNARIGVSVIGDRVQLDGVTAIGNGHLGIHAHRSDALVVSDAEVRGNNRERFDAFHSAGGIKVTETSGFVVQRSSIVDNAGPGVWTDLDTHDVVVASNLITGNTRSGVEIELSQRVVVADNTVHSNGEAGVWVLESRDVDVWHNSVMHNVRDIWIEDGPRADVRNVTVVNNLLGGDAGSGAVRAILNVDDWTEQRGGDDMGIDVGSNRFWLVPGSATNAVSRWAAWPRPLRISTTIEAHRAATGGGVGSDLVVSAIDPFSRSASDGRPSTGSTPGRAPISTVTGVIGTSTSSPAGPLSTPLDPPVGSRPDGVAPGSPGSASPVAPIAADPVAFERVLDTRDGGDPGPSSGGIGAASTSGARLTLF